ncbi:unnamed protein product [Phytomonas sp. EM1]|nr:unnamed protein product [Phytomonas sp. EM1]|eukprot:CCW63388.1 unnamed protein product [Phytomonas sp. isolate EM1]
MLNWWLILVIIILTLVFITLAAYIVLYFQSPEDGKSTYCGKVIFGLSLLLSLGGTLLVTYDVADAPDPTVLNTFSKTLNTVLMWEIVLWIIIVKAIVICPFMMFLYAFRDPEHPKTTKAIIQATLTTLVAVSVFALIVGTCYATVGVSKISFQTYEASGQLMFTSQSGVSLNQTYTTVEPEIKVSFTTYCVGMLSLLGWFVLLFYCGLGFISFPINGFFNFKNRIKRINAADFSERMYVILAKADALLELGKELQREARSYVPLAVKNKIHILRNEVYLLENEQEYLIWSYTKAGGSPFIVYGKLLLNVVCFAIVVAWVLHIIVFNLANADPFLNTLLIALRNAFGVFGILGYSLFALYLYWSTFQGQLVAGLWIFFFNIYPMRPHDTLIHSFLYNGLLMLIVMPTVLVFAVGSFEGYTANTSIGGMVNGYIRHLKGISVFLKWVQVVFLIILLLSMVVTLIYKLVKRKRSRKTISLK